MVSDWFQLVSALCRTSVRMVLDGGRDGIGLVIVMLRV